MELECNVYPRKIYFQLKPYRILRKRKGLELVDKSTLMIQAKKKKKGSKLND
jgi:hypothetical protein